MKEINEEKKTQFRWSMPMLKELLTFLANEVQMGNQPNNSFKSSSHVAPANAILKKFNVKCLPKDIINHLKTVKNAWAIISKLGDKESSFGWDDILKMITVSPIVYNTYTEAYNALQCLCFSLSSHIHLATALHTLLKFLLITFTWGSTSLSIAFFSCFSCCSC